jgi:hypothetical protein
MEKPVGEDMAAIGVGSELDFVDRQKIDAAVERHRFDGAEKIARAGRHDLFLARDQRRMLAADQAADAVVILSRQQPQRKTHHAGAVAQHPLDREMGLAGVGGTEDGGEAGPGPVHGFKNRVSTPPMQAVL